MEEKKRRNEIIATAVSRHEKFCVGYTGTGGYYAGLIMGIGSSPYRFGHAGSQVLDEIISFDAAEVSGAYFGQTNLITVSSFVGIDGLIWGYDVARVDIPLDSVMVSLQDEFRTTHPGVSLWNADGLAVATEALFGTREDLHLPLLPGCLVPTAGRSFTKQGPAYLYAAIGVGIPEGRTRHACLIMEDVGFFTEEIGDAVRTNVFRDIAKSVIAVGEAHHIKYQEILLTMRSRFISGGITGCALVAAPYFQIAGAGSRGNLGNMTLAEWMQTVFEEGML